MPKYLEQIETGRIYPFNEQRAKRKDMRPYDGPVPRKAKPDLVKESAPVKELETDEGGESESDTSEPYLESDGQKVRLSDASKQLLETFAREQFGVELDRRKAQKTLVEEVKALMEPAE